MINNYIIKSGIDKESEKEVKNLSLYLQQLESINSNCCKQLNEIVENDPKTLFEPLKINNDTKFPVKDLAFLISNDKIVGHLLSVFNRIKTNFGYKTDSVVIEEYGNISDEYINKYIISRLEGTESFEFETNEKNRQK